MVGKTVMCIQYAGDIVLKFAIDKLITARYGVYNPEQQYKNAGPWVRRFPDYKPKRM
jgi:hypothetical protein